MKNIWILTIVSAVSLVVGAIMSLGGYYLPQNFQPCIICTGLGLFTFGTLLFLLKYAILRIWEINSLERVYDVLMDNRNMCKGEIMVKNPLELFTELLNPDKREARGILNYLVREKYLVPIVCGDKFLFNSDLMEKKVISIRTKGGVVS